ncbi:MAG: hypothetical protein ACYDD2_06185 [Candidatus Acidiferrales bacterium]
MRVQTRTVRKTESGFALMFVLFLVALLMIGTSVALVNRLTEGQRQKEAEAIWRGQQYERAIGLYYRKFGRFPTSIDDLVKEQNGVRFLREPYKDPMNRKDGSWRFIYVTPAGQLIGSVRYTSLQQMAYLDKQRQLGITAGAGAGAAPGTAGGTNDNSGGPSPAPGSPQAPAGGPGAAPGSLPAPPAPSGGQIGQQANAPPTGSGAPGQQPVQPFFSQGLQMQGGANPGIGVGESSGLSGPVIGGFIIGVGGKSNKPSIKVYKGGMTYKQWEFIFNPLEQIQTIGTLSSGPAPAAGEQPVPFGMPQPPQPPPQPPQNPQQP